MNVTDWLASESVTWRHFVVYYHKNGNYITVIVEMFLPFLVILPYPNYEETQSNYMRS